MSKAESEASKRLRAKERKQRERQRHAGAANAAVRPESSAHAILEVPGISRLEYEHGRSFLHASMFDPLMYNQMWEHYDHSSRRMAEGSRNLAGRHGVVKRDEEGRPRVKPLTPAGLRKQLSIQACHEHEEDPDWEPSVDDLSAFEHDPLVSLINFAVSSGFMDGEGSENLPSVAECSAMGEDYDDSVPGAEE